MKRSTLLHELTGIMGEALRALEAEGVELDERSTRLWADRVIDLYKALPELPSYKLAELVLREEAYDGGLRSTTALNLANLAVQTKTGL